MEKVKTQTDVCSMWTPTKFTEADSYSLRDWCVTSEWDTHDVWGYNVLLGNGTSFVLSFPLILKPMQKPNDGMHRIMV